MGPKPGHSQINDCSSLILILTGGGIPFFLGTYTRSQGLHSALLLEPLLHALSSLPIWPPLTYSKFWAKCYRKGVRHKQELTQVSLLFVSVGVFPSRWSQLKREPVQYPSVGFIQTGTSRCVFTLVSCPDAHI